jgi:hypothetical protein
MIVYLLAKHAKILQIVLVAYWDIYYIKELVYKIVQLNIMQMVQEYVIVVMVYVRLV